MLFFRPCGAPDNKYDAVRKQGVVRILKEADAPTVNDRWRVSLFQKNDFRRTSVAEYL